MVPTTFCQRCLGGPVADRTGPERCPVSASRAGIPGEGETDALLAQRLAAGDDHALAEIFDRLALAEIFDRLAPAVYAAALGVTGQSAAAHEVTFLVQGGTGTFSYAWTVPSGATVTDGCTSTSNLCVIQVRAVNEDQQPRVSVVATQNGSSVTLSARAIINAVCGHVFC